MSYYLKNLENRLTEEEKNFLKDIYEPKVVAIPPVDACCSMCVTPEGEIRIYGSENNHNDWLNFGEAIYISSTDAGLTWKTHKYVKGKTMGSAGYNKNTGRYISVTPTPYRSDLHRESGSYVIINDEGFNSTNNRYIKISDERFEFLKQPQYFESCNRWIAVTQLSKDFRTRVVVCTSDDDGETWNVNILENSAPKYEGGEFDKGVRWQNYSCEPTICELSNGDLLMHIRTAQNYHYMHISTDHGTTWSEYPQPTIFNGTNTMPVLYKLSDGRILFFWCNTELLPEIDQKNYYLPLNQYELTGISEDVFTNRDANHLAISEDDGKTWTGFREVFLSPIRYNADFRRTGEDFCGDKSVHQGQIIELPFNKIMIHFGQHEASTRVVILDVNWLYETSREENLRYGLKNLTTQMYLNSVLGGYKGFVGHCAYNRTNGAYMAPDPDNNFDEALHIVYSDDERLPYKKQGVVWNFPSSESGEVFVKLRVIKNGVRISLLDHWLNAFDETVKDKAHATFTITEADAPNDKWTDIKIKYSKGEAKVFANDVLIKKITVKDMTHGLSYLHIQTLAIDRDFEGTYIKYLKKQ